MKKHQRYITTLSHAIVETSESIFSAAESCVRTLLSFATRRTYSNTTQDISSRSGRFVL